MPPVIIVEVSVSTAACRASREPQIGRTTCAINEVDAALTVPAMQDRQVSSERALEPRQGAISTTCQRELGRERPVRRETL